MRKIRYILIVLLCFNCFVSYAQAKYDVRNIYGFYRERLPGNIPVDGNGNHSYKVPDILITIYIETSGKGPDWVMAWRNGKNYTISLTQVSKTPLEVGINKKTGNKIVLSPPTGNKLWQLDLMQNDKRIYPPQKTKQGEVLLSGKYQGKTIFRKIGSLIQLTTFLSV